MQVKFRYNDGYTKTCSAKEAELLCKMRRGTIVQEQKPAKPRKAPKIAELVEAV